MTFAGKNVILMWGPRALECRNDRLSLLRRNDAVLVSLKYRHRVLDLICTEQRRSISVAIGRFRQRPNHRIEIACLELVRVGCQCKEISDAIETDARLEERLIYGSYPEVVTTNDREQKILYLKEIVNSYLYKDILELDGIRNSDKIVKLLQLLVFQIGKEISHTELGRQLSMSKNTVDRYLDLLEKSFVVFKLRGFSRNLRKEISKNPRYYFYDTGIRNALINNFNLLSMRDDIGMLWENYIIVERLKKQEYQKIPANNYFWRTYDRKEIDFVEESEGKLCGYEIKWSDKRHKPPRQWLETYKDSEYHVITKANYLEFIQ